MKKLFLLLFAGFWLVQLKAQDSAVVLQTPSGNLCGSLYVPQQNGKMPVVLLIAGSGPTDRDGNNPMMKNNSLKMVAEGLCREGIASLRYDKRGIAQSSAAGIEEKDLRFENYVEDAKAWIEYLKKDKRFNTICVAGHSEGALIGILATEGNPAVNKYISIAGTGEPMPVILKRQLSDQPEQIQALTDPIIDRLSQGDTIGNVSPLLYSLFRPSVQPYLISSFKYNPAREIAKLRQPVLLIQGDTDIQVSTRDADLLSEACPDAQKVIITHMNHVLKSCNTMNKNQQIPIYMDPQLPLHPSLVPTIASFIKQ